MDRFTVLSGADIGGSCYLLEIEGVRILLDCGVRVGRSYTEHPDIPDPDTIDAIFVSHAHLDHMGAIAYTAAVCKNAKIYMTEHTKQFVRYQMAATIAEYIGADTDDLKYHNNILCQLVINRVETIKHRDKVCFTAKNGKTCQFSFFHAGHVPGAAMVYMQIGKRTLLYTGDFAANDTSLTGRYSLPESSIKPETVILCGTHSKSPDREYQGTNVLSVVERNLYTALSKNNKFAIPVSQLTKGLEILATLQEMISRHEFPESDVYIEPNLWELAHYYERVSDMFRIPSNSKPLSEWKNVTKPQRPIIVFERPGYTASKYPNHSRINADFSLHADYYELADLLRKLNPKNVFVVHTAKGEGSLQNEAFKSEPKNIIYTENETTYEIL